METVPEMIIERPVVIGEQTGRFTDLYHRPELGTALVQTGVQVAASEIQVTTTIAEIQVNSRFYKLSAPVILRHTDQDTLLLVFFDELETSVTDETKTIDLAQVLVKPFRVERFAWFCMDQVHDDLVGET